MASLLTYTLNTRWLREGCPNGPEAFTFRIRSVIEQLGAEMRKNP